MDDFDFEASSSAASSSTASNGSSPFRRNRVAAIASSASSSSAARSASASSSSSASTTQQQKKAPVVRGGRFGRRNRMLQQHLQRKPDSELSREPSPASASSLATTTATTSSAAQPHPSKSAAAAILPPPSSASSQESSVSSSTASNKLQRVRMIRSSGGPGLRGRAVVLSGRQQRQQEQQALQASSAVAAVVLPPPPSSSSAPVQSAPSAGSNKQQKVRMIRSKASPAAMLLPPPSSSASVQSASSAGSGKQQQQRVRMVRGPRGRRSRLQQQQPHQPDGELEPASSLSFENELLGEEEDNDSTMSLKVSIRGAGTSSLAVQDAGTHRMLHDDCEYLCCTILNSRHPTQAMEAAIDLAIMLSSRSTRAVLWQLGQNDEHIKIQQNQSVARIDDDDFDAFGPSTSNNHNQEGGEGGGTDPKETIFQSVLNVLAKALQRPKGQRMRGNAGNINNAVTPVPNNIGPSTSNSKKSTAGGTMFRTKSARKRMMMQQQQPQGSSASSATGGGGTTSAGAASIQPCMSKEMRQVLTCILYYISWDCTMSDRESVASMGVVKSSRFAKRLRQEILEHPEALRAILNLISLNSSNNSEGSLGSAAAFSLRSQSEFRNNNRQSTSRSSSTRRSRNSTPTKPSPALSSPRLSTTDSLSYIGSISSVSFQEDDLKPQPVVADPTAAGRRGRRQRQKQSIEQVEAAEDSTAAGRRKAGIGGSRRGARKMQPISETATTNYGTDDINDDNMDFGGKVIPPPQRSKRKRRSNNTRHCESFSFASPNDSFVQPISPPRKKRGGVKFGKEDDTESVASTSTIGSVLSTRVSQKLENLLSKISYNTNIGSCSNIPRDVNDDCSLKTKVTNNHDISWISTISLESLDRIIKGKDGESPSCLEPSESDNANGGGGEDDEDVMDEHNNPIMMTNTLLSESQAIPMLGRAMSRSLQSVCLKMAFHRQEQVKKSSGSSTADCSHAGETVDNISKDEYCWAHWEYRLSILASLMDEACLFHKRNRTTFCESNPFSFVDRDGGLIFRIVVLLRLCSRRLRERRSERKGDGNADDKIDNQKLSGIMLLACRTLTSLTHDNELAAEQLTVWYPCEGYFFDEDDDEKMIRGVDVLAEMAFELERGNEVNKDKKKSNQRIDEEALHSFDATNYCLSTLSNIIEAGDVRRTLAEITLDQQESSSKGSLWLRWLCQWVVNQTETFQDLIIGLGKQGKGGKNDKKSSKSTRELHKNEEERLVAAGTGCILLSCIMKEPDEIPEEPEATNTIRQLIIGQLPHNIDGEVSSAYTFMINTLKAFCNYYHFSLGDLSVAVVTPVLQLIGELQEIERQDQTQIKHDAQVASAGGNA